MSTAGPSGSEEMDSPPSAAGGATAVAPTRTRWSRRRWVFLGLGVIALVIVGLGLLAIPLIGLRSDANAARVQLTGAIDALRKGNIELAQTKVASARAHVDSASSRVNGFSGDVWGAIPVAGGAVDDAQHLVSALDDATAIGEIGVQIYPSVIGDQATVVHDDAVDLAVVVNVTNAAKDVEEHLSSARTQLADVKGSAPFVGKSFASARDAALDQITPLQASLDRYQPLLDVLPSVVGADGDVAYLIAVMNPAEMRASGGATLTLGEMTFSNGVATFGDAAATTDFTDNNETIAWTPVPNNPWHTTPPGRVVNASFSPYWTTSGEELLRGWEATSGHTMNALIVIDLQAIARLFEITGPIDVPGYGKLTADNFVTTLAGSYDKFDNADKRKKINEAIIPALRTKVLEGGKFLLKAQALLDAAEGRHFATYFRDPATEAAFADLGLGGDLSPTTHDYIGVFTQNSNASKVDFWEKRTVASDVTLNADGSADVKLTITLDNATPPYTRFLPDPRRGYFTRWSIPGVTVYLPIGAQVTSATMGGTAFTPAMQSERGRPFFQQFVTIGPDGTAVAVISYHEPAAATVEADGSLRYELAIDPHPTVIPGAANVVVHLPAGFTAPTELPDDWTSDGNQLLTYTSPGLDTSPRWSLVARPLAQ